MQAEDLSVSKISKSNDRLDTSKGVKHEAILQYTVYCSAPAWSGKHDGAAHTRPGVPHLSV